MGRQRDTAVKHLLACGQHLYNVYALPCLNSTTLGSLRILPGYSHCLFVKGACLRLDTTLVDFNDMRWVRGDIAFIYNGDKDKNAALTVLDNQVSFPNTQFLLFVLFYFLDGKSVHASIRSFLQLARCERPLLKASVAFFEFCALF